MADDRPTRLRVSALMFQGEEFKVVMPFVAGTPRYIPGQDSTPIY